MVFVYQTVWRYDMRYAEFKKLVLKWPIKYLDIGYPKIYYEIKELKDKTKDINFNCGFNENGLCYKYQKQNKIWSDYPSKKCCCSRLTLPVIIPVRV